MKLNGSPFILNSNNVKAPIPNIKPGIGVFVVYSFEQAAKQYSIVRLIPNHGQRCKEIFYLLYIQPLLPYNLPDYAADLIRFC